VNHGRLAEVGSYEELVGRDDVRAYLGELLQ
jgi:hypothetical protein